MAETPNLPTLVGGGNNDLKSVSALLNSAEGRISEVASRYIRPERLIKVGILAVSRQPLLMECTVESFLLAMMEAAQAGLEPTGFQGEAYLIPRKNGNLTNLVRNQTQNRGIVVREAHFQPGYRGLVKVMCRDPNIGNVEARAVYDGDAFDFDLGLEPHLHHKPVPPSQRATPGPEGLIAVYAVTRFRDPKMPDHFEVMWREDVEAVRRSSENAGGSNSPWTNWYEQMARKSVIRREAKLVPVETETAAVMEYDEMVEMGHRASLGALSPAYQNLLPETPVPEEATRTDAAREKIRVRREGQESQGQSASGQGNGGGQDPEPDGGGQGGAPQPQRDNSDVDEATLALRTEYRRTMNVALTESGPVPDQVIAEWEKDRLGSVFTEMSEFQLRSGIDRLKKGDIPGRERVPGEDDEEPGEGEGEGTDLFGGEGDDKPRSPQDAGH